MAILPPRPPAFVVRCVHDEPKHTCVRCAVAGAHHRQTARPVGRLLGDSAAADLFGASLNDAARAVGDVPKAKLEARRNGIEASGAAAATPSLEDSLQAIGRELSKSTGSPKKEPIHELVRDDKIAPWEEVGGVVTAAAHGYRAGRAYGEACAFPGRAPPNDPRPDIQLREHLHGFEAWVAAMGHYDVEFTPRQDVLLDGFRFPDFTVTGETRMHDVVRLEQIQLGARVFILGSPLRLDEDWRRFREREGDHWVRPYTPLCLRLDNRSPYGIQVCGTIYGRTLHSPV